MNKTHSYLDKYGMPEFYLKCKLEIDKTSFDEACAVNEIEELGALISIAKKYFSNEEPLVTEKGYLLTGVEWNYYIKEFEKQVALIREADNQYSCHIKTQEFRLNVSSNKPGLFTLDKIMKGEIEYNEKRPRVHMNHVPSGEIYTAIPLSGMLLFKELHDSFDSKVF